MNFASGCQYVTKCIITFNGGLSSSFVLCAVSQDYIRWFTRPRFVLMTLLPLWTAENVFLTSSTVCSTLCSFRKECTSKFFSLLRVCVFVFIVLQKNYHIYSFLAILEPRTVSGTVMCRDSCVDFGAI